MVKKLPAMRKTWVQSLGWVDPPEKEGHGNPLQYSWLENSMDRGAWRAAVHRVAELDTTEQLTYYFFQPENLIFLGLQSQN